MKKKSTKGLTLIELVLAIVILSFISLAMGSMSLSAARLITGVNEETRLQNEIVYVLRDVELNIKSGKDPVVTVADCPNGVPSCAWLTVTDPDDNPVAYSYDAVSQTFSRTVGGNTQNLSAGILVSRPGQAIFVARLNKLVEINIAAQRTLVGGRTANVPGISKSVLLKGAS